MGRASDTVRLPLVPPTEATRVKLERLAGELGLLKFAVPAGDMHVY
jgi:4-hydroxy-tetrahydrodipicolinate synthase